MNICCCAGTLSEEQRKRSEIKLKKTSGTGWLYVYPI